MRPGFLAMGGYAVWVWSAYAAALAVLVANAVAANRRYRQALSRTRRGLDRQGRAG